MKIIDRKQRVIRWESKKFGLCEATLWDGQLTDFRFCINGSDINHGVYTANVQYLRELYNVLHDLLEVIDTMNVNPDLLDQAK